MLKISISTLLRRIRSIASELRPPYILKGKQYEVDEIKAFVGSKRCKFKEANRGDLKKAQRGRLHRCVASVLLNTW